MWLMTKAGFFSVVQKPTDRAGDTLTIRGRVKQDLETIRREYLPSASPVREHSGTDYPFRIVAARVDFAAALTRIALDIDYSNFKNEIEESQGSVRAYIYGEIWSCLTRLEDGAD